MSIISNTFTKLWWWDGDVRVHEPISNIHVPIQLSAGDSTTWTLQWEIITFKRIYHRLSFSNLLCSYDLNSVYIYEYMIILAIAKWWVVAWRLATVHYITRPPHFVWSHVPPKHTGPHLQFLLKCSVCLLFCCREAACTLRLDYGHRNLTIGKQINSNIIIDICAWSWRGLM